MNKMNKKGFTLIEMLVVIAIIAVLVAIIVPTVSKSTTKAKAAADAANLRSIAAQVATDYLDNDSVGGTYTATAKSVTATGIQVFEENNGINAYFVTKEGVVGVDALAKAATDGSTPAAVTAPTSGSIYKNP